ncbi:MAG: histidine phosphatase family protein [Candidatus Adiutrix sp.]|jgi:probable phosphoglycerate mutase|nr:histidine phosphatase family protein [Candidatus Adiutrix sp.]
MKHLIFARHGNTFRPGETARRVGRRTDPPLVETERGLSAGARLLAKGLKPDRIYAAPLQRTRQTAALILRKMSLDLEIQESEVFSEIDYGEDENKSEDQVIERLGRAALAGEGRLAGAGPEDIILRGQKAVELWNSKAVPPPGWPVDPEKIIGDLRHFADGVNEGETVLAVSSNGIIRFTPHILRPGDCRAFTAAHNLKVATGGLCIFKYENGSWSVTDWNIKP